MNTGLVIYTRNLQNLYQEKFKLRQKIRLAWRFYAVELNPPSLAGQFTTAARMGDDACASDGQSQR